MKPLNPPHSQHFSLHYEVSQRTKLGLDGTEARQDTTQPHKQSWKADPRTSISAYRSSPTPTVPAYPAEPKIWGAQQVIHSEDNALVAMLLNTWKAKMQLSKE